MTVGDIRWSYVPDSQAQVNAQNILHSNNSGEVTFHGFKEVRG